MSNIFESGPIAARAPGRPISGEMDPIREKFLLAYAQTGNTAVSARFAGISVDSGRKWLRDSDSAAAVHSVRERIIRTTGASLGLKVLMDLARDVNVPATVRRQAARDLLGLAGHSEAVAAGDVASQGQRRGLGDLSADELARLQAAAAATLDQLRRPVVDVTPEDAPDSSPGASLL